MMYAVTLSGYNGDTHTEFVEASTPAKARWQAIRHRLEWLDRKDRRHLFDGVKVCRCDTQPETDKARAERAMVKWNENVPIGTQVRYWRGVRGDGFDKTAATRSKAQMLGEHAVVWIDGCVGCIALTHVEVIP